MGHYTYLILDFLAIIVPFLYSFDKRLNFYKRWKYFFPALAIAGGVFIAWDVYFTKIGVWGFNPRYLVGIDLLGLPIEEWLFFLCIPYACVFTYEALKVLMPEKKEGAWVDYLTWGLIAILLLIAFTNLDKAYTATTFISASIYLFIQWKWLGRKYLGRFFIAYGMVLLPFFLINGVLTGSWIEGEVVWYNDAENLGIRMVTIPVEDTFYGMLLILMNVSLLELFSGRSNQSPSGAS